MYLGFGGASGKAQPEEIHNQPRAVEVFRAPGSESGARPAEVSPLIAQAEAYARLLDSPRIAQGQ